MEPTKEQKSAAEDKEAEKKAESALVAIHNDLEKATKITELLKHLNTNPPESWTKNHPQVNKARYIPIERIEMIMDQIFQEWRVEVVTFQQLVTSLAVQVRLHYKHPITGEWMYHDGLGAVPIEMKSGSKDRTDLNNVNIMAVQKNLPAAKSFAIRNAATHIGKFLGRDLNRESLDYGSPYSNEDRLNDIISDTNDEKPEK